MLKDGQGMEQTGRAIPIAKALFAVVVWGASFIATKIALAEVRPPRLPLPLNLSRLRRGPSSPRPSSPVLPSLPPGEEGEVCLKSLEAPLSRRMGGRMGERGWGVRAGPGGAVVASRDK